MTIADVAARAGVGASTVSRVLNDGQVSAPARERVIEAMNDLAYRPQASARALASGSTETLGHGDPVLHAPVGGRARARRGRRHGRLAVRARRLQRRATRRSATTTSGRRAPVDRSDGLLVDLAVAARRARSRRCWRAASRSCSSTRTTRGCRASSSTTSRAASSRPRHLLELGHERIAFVGDTTDPRYGFVSSRQRFAGYCNALAAAGIPLRHRLQRFGPHGRHVAHRLTAELLSLDEPPTAIFAASDTQALGVLEAAGYEGVDVPGELSVIGFDGLEVAPYVGLTTVAQPLYESGRRGVERLLALIDGEDPGPLEERLELRLEVRRTTAPPP